jgi:outer membrane protein TolC
MKIFDKKYIAFACGISFVVSILDGCYSPPPIPDAVFAKEYKSIEKEQHSFVPADSSCLLLAEALRIALANNPDYRSAKHSVTAAWARFYSAGSAYLPELSAEYNVTEYKYLPLSSGGTGKDGGGNRYSQKTGGLRAQWEIFNGLVTTMKVLSARKEASQYEELDRDAKRLLVENVTNAYNNILLSLEKIRITQDDMTFNESLLHETQIKYDAGAVPLSEPLNFKVNVNKAKSALIDETYNFINAKFILAELMGLTEAKLPDNIKFEKLPENTFELSQDINIYLDSALANRPDLEAYRKALEMAKFNLWSKYGAFFPTVSVDGFWGYSRNDDGYSGRYKYTARTQDRSFNYGVSANWTIFSGGKRIADLREAQALLANSREELLERWIRVVAEIRQAHENFKRMLEQVSISKETFELVKKTRDLVEEEYKAGNTSITRLNEAQNDLVNADVNLASAIINLENAKTQLDSARGSFTDLQ